MGSGWDTVGHYFYVLAEGNAVNFLPGTSVGAFIFLVQAEILVALSRLTANNTEPGYHELPNDASPRPGSPTSTKRENTDDRH